MKWWWISVTHVTCYVCYILLLDEIKGTTTHRYMKPRGNHSRIQLLYLYTAIFTISVVVSEWTKEISFHILKNVTHVTFRGNHSQIHEIKRKSLTGTFTVLYTPFFTIIVVVSEWTSEITFLLIFPSLFYINYQTTHWRPGPPLIWFIFCMSTPTTMLLERK